MAETHELRVKIDAGAAERGSRQFVSAVAAIRAAVRGMERDSSGAFTRLHKNVDKMKEMSTIKMAGFDKRALTDLDTPEAWAAWRAQR